MFLHNVDRTPQPIHTMRLRATDSPVLVNTPVGDMNIPEPKSKKTVINHLTNSLSFNIRKYKVEYTAHTHHCPNNHCNSAHETNLSLHSHRSISSPCYYWLRRKSPVLRNLGPINGINN